MITLGIWFHLLTLSSGSQLSSMWFALESGVPCSPPPLVALSSLWSLALKATFFRTPLCHSLDSLPLPLSLYHLPLFALDTLSELNLSYTLLLSSSFLYGIFWFYLQATTKSVLLINELQQKNVLCFLNKAVNKMRFRYSGINWRICTTCSGKHK